MHFHFSISPASERIDRSGLASYWPRLPKIRLGGLFRRLSIRHKIGCGYALAICIALLGTTAGFCIEKYFKAQAKEQLLQVHQQTYILKDLQDAVLQAKAYQQQMLFMVTFPEKYVNVYENRPPKFGDLNFRKHQILPGISSDTLTGIQKIGSEPQITELIQNYTYTVEKYYQQLEEFSSIIYRNALQPQQAEEMQMAMIKFINSDIAKQFNKFAEELSVLNKKLYVLEEKEFFEYQQAENIGNIILVSSLLLSAAIAGVIAIYISWAIARPLEFTTAVARRVTETGNFKLIAPVIAKDEVGQLATSLNQLIQRVAVYTEELKHAQAQLIQTEKMSSLGQMVAGIAHEINNPVNFIYGNISYLDNYTQELLDLLELYQQEFPQPTAEIKKQLEASDVEFIAQDLPKILNSMQAGAKRIQELVLSLRNFSRLDESELKKVDLHEGIESTLMILNERLKGTIAVDKDYDKLPPIECYPAQLNQVFFNIINNAIDALHSCVEQRNKQITIKTDKVWSSEIRVSITDNGCGIPLEIQNKIFDPFFTTKPVGQGTGLGLAISYKIIEKHGGKIQVCSQPGKGTELAIFLPIEQSFCPLLKSAWMKA